MGIYNFGANKEHYVLTGYYAPFLPQLPSDEMFRVDYDIVNSRSVTWEDVIANLPVEGARMAIKTKTVLHYEPNAYFKAQDGTWFQIVDVTIDPVKADKRALSVFKKSVSTEYTLRLIQIEYNGGVLEAAAVDET